MQLVYTSTFTSSRLQISLRRETTYPLHLRVPSCSSRRSRRRRILGSFSYRATIVLHFLVRCTTSRQPTGFSRTHHTCSEMKFRWWDSPTRS